MSVSDLTNYTWVGNTTLNLGSSETSYDINFTCQNVNYQMFMIKAFGDNYLCYDSLTLGTLTAYDTEFGSGWISNDYKTITITGGTDVTNSSLINWLQNNGTLQESGGGDTPIATGKIGDLSIIKKHFGDLEVIKEVLNGFIIYEKNDTPTPTPITYPTVSDIIFIDLDGNGKKPYRVLKNVSGTTYEIMSMDDNIIISQRYSSSSQNYSGSEIDTRLNSTFYNTLTQTAKSSIVDKTYDIYQYNNNNGQLGTRVNSPTTLTRHIYTIDADMINEYLTATSSNLNDMLWCGYYPSPSVVIGTATGVRYGYYYSILGSTNSITTSANRPVTSNAYWRPVMQIDLSKIEFLLDCYKVAVKFAETNAGKKTSSSIYDGQSNSGELVYLVSGSYVPSNFSVVPITSGYLYWEFRGTSVKITSITKTGTITINGQTNDNYATISSDGAITFTINYNG